MANTDTKIGLHPKSSGEKVVKDNLIATGETTKDGDILYRKPAGTLSGTYDSAYPIAGVQCGSIYDPVTGDINATATSGDKVDVFADPGTVFIAQISTYTATDPYTTRSSAACYDVAGSAGAQYVNASSSSQDDIKVLGLSCEYNKGAVSAVGAYAKIECMINPDKHERGNYGAV